MPAEQAAAPAPPALTQRSPQELMLRQMAAGAAAGAVAKTATAPLERIKILFQVQVRVPPDGGAAGLAAARAPAAPLVPLLSCRLTATPTHLSRAQGMQGKDLLAPKYTGIVQATGVVLREEGALALWKGNGANVLRVVPVYGLKFAFNDSIKAVVAGPSKRRLDMSDLLWVGTLAGLLQTALTYPLETVRTRLTLGPEQGVRYTGIVDCFKQIVRTEGWGGL
jgi:solute carrier family 25 phosphate transporter 23/24/25/41